MVKRTVTSPFLILAISLVVAFNVSSAFAATEFKTVPANVPQLTDQKLHVDNEIIVKFKDDSSSFLAEGTSVMAISKRGGFKRLRVSPGRSIDDILKRYRSNPNVEYAEPNYIYHATMTPNDTYYSYQWHMPAINVESGWDISTGSGVLLGIIDTGVAYENYGSYQKAPDLAGTNFVAGYDFVNNDSHANDDNAHGTHVCGTIAQTTNNNLGCAGVAFNCTIMPIKVLDSGGSGYVSDIADGIYYAADNGCQVINMSLGGPSGSSTLQNAVAYAYNAGVTIVCAAGNAGTSTPQYPAAYEQCISVSATRYDDTKPSYSSYGSTIDICAPGGDIEVDQNGDGYGDGVLQQTFTEGDPTDFGYWFYEGTSMASPHAAGAAAIVIAAGGGSMSPSQVRNILESTATDLGASGWDQYYGHGKVNVYAAALEAQGGGNPPVADFVGSPTSGEAPLTVYFTDQSTNDPTSWDWDFGDGGGSSAQNPSHQYTSAGTYTVSLTATNAYGSDTETKTNYITVTEAGDWTTITYDDFEGGFGSYTDGGNDCALYTGGTYAHQGSNAADIQDNSGVASSFYHTGSYNVTGYGELEVEFWFYAVSMDNSNEDFWVQYYDGSTWQTVAAYARSVDFENNVFYNKVVAIPKGTYNYPTNAKLRFMCDASGDYDDVYIDEIRFRGKSAGPVAPTAEFVGDPTSGIAPLTVSFTDLSTGEPTSWDWDFGDGGGSAAQNPSHQYTSVGTYTVSLTATNAYGSDTETKNNYITVTEPSEDVMHVTSIYVSRQTWWILARGVATVKIVDQNNAPVSGATVYGDFTGPNSGSYNGATDANGEVTFMTGYVWGPSGEWCFEVTNVTKSGWTYDSAANDVTKSCESGDVYSVSREQMMASGPKPEVYALHQNYPNPFNPTTTVAFSIPEKGRVRLTIYNVAGEVVQTLVDREMEAGIHTVDWHAANVSSGVYFYRLQAKNFVATRKMLLLR
jgi:serine protease